MKSNKSQRGGLVYSTGKGRMCPNCARPLADCACRRSPRAPKGDGIVRVSRETKGRKGKGVTLVTGLPLPPDDLADLAGELKRKCGAGGTVKDGNIELQGDRRDVVVELLRERGYEVKRAGG